MAAKKKAPSKKSSTASKRSTTAQKRTASSRSSAASKTNRSSSSRSRSAASGSGGHSAHALLDHEEIRQWAEERDARPSCVRGTGDPNDIGMIRLNFPGFGGEESLEEISWDEWFEKFDERNLALMVQETTAGGEQSNFNKLVSRDTAESTRKPKTRSAH